MAEKNPAKKILKQKFAHEVKQEKKTYIPSIMLLKERTCKQV